MGIIRWIRKKIHDYFNPPIEDIIRRYSTAGRTGNLTMEQIEELYELIDSFGKNDAGEDCDKADDRKGQKDKTRE